MVRTTGETDRPLLPLPALDSGAGERLRGVRGTPSPMSPLSAPVFAAKSEFQAGRAGEMAVRLLSTKSPPGDAARRCDTLDALSDMALDGVVVVCD